MPKSKATNIVRMDWLRNRTPTGKRSAIKARKLAHYLALGRGRPAEQMTRQQRGQWLDQTGQVRSHADVIEWVNREGKENQFTHQFILSVKDIPLAAEAFNRAMAAGGDLFQEWRLIRHEDTSYPHAHALAFGPEEVRLKSESFREWWQQVREVLEQERQAALVQQQERQLQQEQALQQEEARRQEQEQALQEEQTKEQEQHLENDQLLADTDEDDAMADKREQQQGWGLGW